MKLRKYALRALLVSPLLLAAQWALAENNKLANSFAGVDLTKQQWNHGSENCNNNTEPGIQTVQVNRNSFVLRQNKCVSFEAPFMYLLVGTETALLLDTGDSDDQTEFALFKIVSELISNNFEGPRSLLVLHSHGHQDHRLGDKQFVDKAGVEIVGVKIEDLTNKFDLKTWPETAGEIDLGERILSIIPTPGHHAAAITVFDHDTGWMLTGDSFYPGSIRVHTWNEFKRSISKLIEFADTHEVTGLLGGHIEMSTKGMYKIGSTYQPDELPLALSINDLRDLNSRLQGVDKPKKLKFAKFVISPLSWFEKRLINTANALLGD